MSYQRPAVTHRWPGNQQVGCWRYGASSLRAGPRAPAALAICLRVRAVDSHAFVVCLLMLRCVCYGVPGYVDRLCFLGSCRHSCVILQLARRLASARRIAWCPHAVGVLVRSTTG